MRPRCAHCALEFEPEQGFYVGAIYLNYAATVAIAMPGYFIIDYFTAASIGQQIVLWGAFAILFPLLFFRHSRSLWLGLVCLMSSNGGGETSRSRNQRGA